MSSLNNEDAFILLDMNKKSVFTWAAQVIIQGVFFTGPPPEKLKYGKPRLGEVRCILDVPIHLTSPNLGFPYFNFSGGGPVKKTSCN